LDEQRTPDRQTRSAVKTRRKVRLRSAAFQQATQKCDDQLLPVTAIFTRKITPQSLPLKNLQHVLTYRTG